MISERNKKTKVTNGSRFFRNAIVLLGTFSMSLMPVYSCTSESAGSVVSQQSKKPVAKKKQPQRAAVKKKVTINQSKECHDGEWKESVFHFQEERCLQKLP